MVCEGDTVVPRLKLANILLLNILVIASLCPGANAAEPYEINAILPLTGAAAFIGSAEAKSLGVIEELTNRLGGIE